MNISKLDDKSVCSQIIISEMHKFISTVIKISQYLETF